MNQITQKRWLNAQVAESKYWDELTIKEILRICTEKPDFLDLVGNQMISSLFEQREIMEIGVGPLGISLASFYANKHSIKRLVKVEPLKRRLIIESSIMEETWAKVFLEWVQSLSDEGEYIQLPGEQMDYNQEFDTVIIYNVLDHVKDPLSILKNAYKAIRKEGEILVGVDCRSLLGRIKFEYILRKTHKGQILVEAHPHTFLPTHVVKMLNQAGFQEVKTIGVPGLMGKFTGKTYRPAFIGKKLF
jgi:SAM-dependent methyltransferase